MSASAIRLEAAAGNEFAARQALMRLNQPVTSTSRRACNLTDRRGRVLQTFPRDWFPA